MTGRSDGRSADVPPDGPPTPLTISAICHTDALVDALSARHFVVTAGPRRPGAPDGGDPAARLLQSLILDVDQGIQGAPALSSAPPSAPSPPAEPEPGAEPVPSSPGTQGRPRRLGARTVMALGISTAVLGTTGVAAASGELSAAIERAVEVRQPPDHAHPDSRAKVDGTGRSVVEGPPAPAAPSGSEPGARPAQGTPGGESGRGTRRAGDRFRLRFGTAPDGSEDRDRSGPYRAPDQVQGRGPESSAPTRPDGHAEPRDDDGGAGNGGGDGDDEGRGSGDPCPDQEPAGTPAPTEQPGPC